MRKKILASLVMPVVTLGAFSGAPLVSANSFSSDHVSNRYLRHNVLDLNNRIFHEDFLDRNRSIIREDFNDIFDDDFNRVRRLSGEVTFADPETRAVWVRLDNGSVVRVLVDDDTRFGFDDRFDGLRLGRHLNFDCDSSLSDGFRAVSIDDNDISLF